MLRFAPLAALARGRGAGVVSQAARMTSWQGALGQKASSSLQDQLRDRSLLKTDAFVGGKWVDTGSTFSVLDPASGDVLCEVAACGPKEVEAAVAAADAAQKQWAKTTGKHRAGILRRWFDLMVANQEDLSLLLTLEAGKPLAEAKGEIAYAASFFEWCGQNHSAAPRFP